MAFVSAPFAFRSRTWRPDVCSPRAGRFTTGASRPIMALTVNKEKLPNSQMELDIRVGQEECEAAYKRALKEIAKDVKVDGFRRGKVPRALLENAKYGPIVRSTALEHLIEDSIAKAIKQNELRTIGQARFTKDNVVNELLEAYSPRGEISFQVLVDVWPEATFSSPYTELKVEAEDVPVGDDVVDGALEEMRDKEAFSVLSPEGTTADYGNLAVVDLKGFYELDDGSRGDELPALADGENIEVELKQGKFFAGFVEGLIGAKAGEVREVHLTFPEHNPRPELAGRKAIFDVTVNAIKDKVVPELDDEFAKRVSEADNMESLREQVRGRLRAECEAAREKNASKALEDALANIVIVELPETLLENQTKRNFAQMMSGFSASGMSDEQVKAMVTKDNYDLYRERGRPKAERALRINFAVDAIAKENNLTVSTEDVEAQMDLARSEMKGQDFAEDEVRDQIEAQLERDLVIAKLKETAQITFVPPAEEKQPLNVNTESVTDAETVDVEPVAVEK